MRSRPEEGAAARCRGWVARRSGGTAVRYICTVTFRCDDALPGRKRFSLLWSALSLFRRYAFRSRASNTGNKDGWVKLIPAGRHPHHCAEGV